MKFLCRALLCVCVLLSFVACKKSEQPITFADPGWGSVRLQTAIVRFIVEKAYGIPTREVSGSSLALHEGLKKNTIDVHLEVWTENVVPYLADKAAGNVQELGLNFDDNQSGFYVPRYVIEGDPARNIAPLAPHLRRVEDLKQYSHIFSHGDKSALGRIYGAVPGWTADTIMYNKFKYYRLDKVFVYHRPETEEALRQAFIEAWEKGLPIVGYHWTPTTLLGQYDFVLLDEAPYEDSKKYKMGATASPSMRIVIASSNDFCKKYPKIAEFLRHYKNSSILLSQGMNHMQQQNISLAETARWFLRNNDALLEQWLPPEKATLVREALASGNT